MKTIELCFIEYFRTKHGHTLRGNQLKAARQLADKQRNISLATGEGKTAVAALAAAILLSKGRRVYMVTVNDYLAGRDYSGFHDFYETQGFAASLNTRSSDKISVHAADIIYTSVDELLFDYVSNEFDNFPFDLDAAILDEIDYVLLDNANTRFSVSQGDGCFLGDISRLEVVWRFVQNLTGMEAFLHRSHGSEYFKEQKSKAEYEYAYNSGKKEVELTERGVQHLEDVFKPCRWSQRYSDLLYWTHTALLAKHCYKNGVDYIADGSGLKLVNSYNGRAMPNCAYDSELDYFLRLKENLPSVTPPAQANTMHTPLFFRKFKTVVGLSGTAIQADDELQVITGSRTRQIKPYNKPKRRDDGVLFFESKNDKYAHIENFIKRHGGHYSYLIISESDNEAVAIHKKLFLSGVEADIFCNLSVENNEDLLIRQASHPGNVLISTNLLGRGTDIVINTANVKGGLAVFVTYLGTSKRDDMQAIGRAGRNGCVGYSAFLLSSEDELFKVLPEKDRKKKNAHLAQRIVSSNLEAARAITGCEEILLEAAKQSLREWIDAWRELNADGTYERLCVYFPKELIADFYPGDGFSKLLEAEWLPYWLDFRKSLSGRLFIHSSGSFNETVYNACMRVKHELEILVRDVLWQAIGRSKTEKLPYMN